MEAAWFKSDRHRGGLTGEMPVVVCLSLCGRYVADGLKQAMLVGPRMDLTLQRGRFETWFSSRVGELRCRDIHRRRGVCHAIADGGYPVFTAGRSGMCLVDVFPFEVCRRCLAERAMSSARDRKSVV